jgi:Tfp pilus assembly protein PilV
MELTNRKARSSQRGMSLIELMIASLVLIVGVLGCAALIPIAIGTNSRNRQQSNSTVIAQMTMEKITSLPVGTLTGTMTDCAAPANTYTINTAGSTAGTGATLLSSGTVDFTQALGGAGAPAGYYLLYTTCSLSGGQSTFDVRWNIQTPSAYVKLVTVSAQLRGRGANQILFSLPVTIRSMVGGS